MRGLLSWFPKVEILYAGKGHGWSLLNGNNGDTQTEESDVNDIVCVHPHGLFVIGGILFLVHTTLLRLDRALADENTSGGYEPLPPSFGSFVAAPFL